MNKVLIALVILSLSLAGCTAEDEPYLHVNERYVGQDKEGEDKTFKVHEEEQAIECYKNMLRRNGVKK